MQMLPWKFKNCIFFIDKLYKLINFQFWVIQHRMNKGNSLDILVGIPHLWIKASKLSGIKGTECKYCRKVIITNGYVCEICSFPIHKNCMLKPNISSCGNVAPHQLESRAKLAHYLEKRPPKIISKSRSAVSRTKWQRRWFVLTKDCNIFYFKDKSVNIQKKQKLHR